MKTFSPPKYWLILFLQKITFIILTVFIRLFIRLEIYGIENILSLKPPVIIVANHKGYFDHWLLGMSAVRRFNSPLLPLRFFAADKYFKIWWTGWGYFTRLSGAFPTRRGEGLEVSLKESMEILTNGGTIIFYPEGKIIRGSSEIGKPRRGIGALGLWSNAKIIPAAIKRANDSGKANRVIFGAPFLVKDVVPKDKLKHTEENYIFAAEAIMEKVKDLYHGV